MAVNKITGFKAPYTSGFFRDIVDSIAGMHGVLDLGGEITQTGPTITVPPFRVVQNGLIYEKDVPTTLSAPSMAAPFYLVVTAPTVNPVDDLMFTFAKTPEDVSADEVILGSYDAFEWRESQLISTRGILDLIAQTNIDTLRVGPFDGLKTSLNGPNYENTPGTLVDRAGETQRFNEIAVFPVVPVDPDWDRVDRIAYRRPRDYPNRIGVREFLLGGTYETVPAALPAVESFDNSFVRQHQKALVLSDNTAHILSASGAGTVFQIDYTKISSDRLSTVIAATTLFTGVSSGAFDAAIDSSDNFHIVYVKGGNICYRKFSSLGVQLVSETVIDTQTGACANPRVSIDPDNTKVFVVYQALMGPNNNQIFFTSRSLAGALVTAPKNVASSAQNLITPDIFVSEDLYVFITWENDTLGSVLYRRFDDIGDPLDASATTVSSNVEQIGVGTLTGGASNPRVLVADNRQIFVLFRQDKGGSAYGVSVFTEGAAFMQELTGPTENIISFDVATDPIFNSLMLSLVQASTVAFVKVYGQEVSFGINLVASGSLGSSLVRDKLGSLLHVYSSAASGTYTSYDATSSIIAFGAVSVVGGITTINVDADQFLVTAASLSQVPNADDRVVITGSGVGGNNTTKLITEVELLSLDAIDDVYRITVVNNFTGSEEPSTANGDFQAPDGNNAVYQKSVSESHDRVFGLFELESDILLSRMLAPGSTILNWLPPGSAGSLADFLIVSGTGRVDWEATAPGNFTITGMLKMTNIFTATEYTLTPGSYPMSEGDALYVELDPSDLTPTPQVTPLPTLPWNLQIGVLGVIIDGTFQPGQAHLRPLTTGEEQDVGQALPVAIRDRLGIIDDVTYYPYTSTNHINAGDDYVEAFSNLDTAIQNIIGQLFMTVSQSNPQRVVVSGVDKVFLIGSTFGSKYKRRLIKFDGAEIDFSTGVIYESDGITPLGTAFSPVVPGAGLWRWFAVNLLPGAIDSDNRINLELKVTAAAADGATQNAAPRATFTAEPDVGQVAVTSPDGSTISNLVESNIVNLLTSFETSEGDPGNEGTQLQVTGNVAMDWEVTTAGEFTFGAGLRVRDLITDTEWLPVAGGYAMSEDDALYILLDPSVLAPTPLVTPVSSLPYSLPLFVIGVIRDGLFVPTAPNLKTLESGEEWIFGYNLSQVQSERLGIPSNTSFDAYPTNDLINANDNYAEAIGNLDQAVYSFLTQISMVPKSPTSSRVVITGADKTMLPGWTLSLEVDGLLVDFDGAEIDFQTGIIYASDGMTPLGNNFAPVIPAASNWRWFAVNLEANVTTAANRVTLVFNVTPALSDGISQAAAPRAEFDVTPRVGQVATFSSDGSTINPIAAGQIVNLPTLGSGAGGGSTIVKAVAGENLTVNDLVYISPGSANGDTGRTQGRLYKVDAGNGTPALAAIRSQGLGFVLATVLSGATAKVITSGTQKNFVGLTQGVSYYADPSVIGGITTIRPTTADQWVVPVGVAISATQIEVNYLMASDAELVQLITTFSALAGENLAANDLVYLSPGNGNGDTGRTQGQLYKVDAGNATPALAEIRSQGMGFATTAVTAGSTALVATGGLQKGFVGLTQGLPYYADPSVIGGVTSTKPTTADQWVLPVGIAASATQIEVNYLMASDAELILAPVSLTDWDVNQVAHGFVVGNAIYFDGTNWVKARADSAYTLSEAIVSAVADVDNFTARVVGPVSGLSGLTPGAYYFTDASTAGALTSTEPTAPYFSNPVGFALSATELMVLPLRPAVGGSNALTYFFTALAGENLTDGDLVYLSPGTAQGDTSRTQGRLYKVDAGNGTPALAAIRSRALGIITITALAGAATEAQLAGEKNGFVGLVPGFIYYADPSVPGALTSTKPTTVGQWSVPVGLGTSVTQLYINTAMAGRAELVEADVAPTDTFTAGENLTANELVYVSPGSGNGDTGRTQGRVYKVDAGNGTPALAAIRSQAAGFVQATVTSGNPAVVQASRSMSGFAGLTQGMPYYADPSTPGAITATKPSTLGQWVVPVGIAFSSTSILVNPSMSPDSSIVALQSGIETITGLAGENLTANDLVYLSPGNADGDTGRTAGRYYRVDAGNVTPALALIRSQGVGFVQATVTSGNTATIQRAGPMSGFSSLVTGKTYYADPSNIGLLTVTRPSSATQYIVPVGFARDATSIQINPAISSDAETASSGGGLSAPVVKTGAYNLVDGDRIIANTSGGPFTMTLPPAPSIGDEVEFWDSQSTWGTNNLTVARNGSQIEGTATDLVCNVSGGKVQMVYMAGSRGWGVFVS